MVGCEKTPRRTSGSELGPHGASGSAFVQEAGRGGKRSSVGAIGKAVSNPSTPPSVPRGPRSPSASSLEDGADSPCSTVTRVLKVPDVAIPMQHSLLKRISAFQSKEELLEFVSHYHCLLDLINLVTCLYRLAKMSKEASRGRNSYLAELQRHPTFQLLLRSISSKFLQGHLNYLHTQNEGMKGVDGRCLANLTWALAKLDLSSDDSALTTELALTVAPFIIRTLDTSSPQGLANMLWSYAKLPVAPPAVVSALVAKITDQLVAQAMRGDGASTFDAQALSNSIWALAHLKSRGMEVDAAHNAAMMRFMTELAAAAARALVRPHSSLPPPGSSGAEPRLAECQRYLALVEREFSCQALVNIAWSFATLLGPACCQQGSIQHLFALIHNESLTRLRCTAVVLGTGQSLPYVGGGGFNEQALSNAVYAFDKVGLLSSELLAAVFEVSALRLRRGSMAHHPDLNTFKPQELCTLLKACHTNIAPPWVFLSSLLRLLSAHPTMADAWTTAERLELHRACQLFSAHQAEAAAAVAAASRQGLAAADFSQAVHAAQGLANSIASSISAASGAAAGAPASGALPRLSGLGGSPPSLSMMGDARLSSGAGGGAFGRPRSSSGASGAACTLGPAASEAPTTTFGQLPVSAAAAAAMSAGLGPSDLQLYEHLLRAQQQQQQQQQQQGVSALLQQGLASLAGQQLLSCPVCSGTVRRQDALSHIEACLANRDAAAAGLEFLLRQQQQSQQQQQEAAVRWAAVQQQQQQQAAAQAAQQQQHNNLVLARLQQLQQQQAQQNYFNAAVARQQQQQQSAALLGSLEELCRPAGGNEAASAAAWMLEANAASRPPPRPARRM